MPQEKRVAEVFMLPDDDRFPDALFESIITDLSVSRVDRSMLLRLRSEEPLPDITVHAFEDVLQTTLQLNDVKAVFEFHLSQFPHGCAHGKAISAYLKLRSADFGLRSLKGCAEGFRVLGTTQMHCLPEAGD